MSSKECETQLNELLEAWDLDEAILNQTDIEAIKHLLLENQMQQDVIISYKTKNLDQAVDIQQLERENQELKEVIEEVREYIDNNTEFEHDGDDYGYTEWVNIKPQNIVFINELLQILDKVKHE